MEEPRYVSYASVAVRYGPLVLLASLLVAGLTYGISMMPSLQRYKAEATILFPLRKSAAGIRRALGSVDIPVGTVSSAIGQMQETYAAPTILKSRTLNKNVLEQFPEVMATLDKKGTGDWELIRQKATKKHLKLNDDDQGALRIGFLWTDPKTSADVTNAYVAELRRMLTVLNTRSATGMTTFISQRLEGGGEAGPGIRQRITELEAEIAAYKTKEGILALEPQAEQLIKTAAALQEELTKAEVDLAESAMKLQAVRRQGQFLQQRTGELYQQKDVFDLTAMQDQAFLSLGDEEPSWAAVPLAEALEDAAITTLRRNLSVLENERASKRLLFTDDHPTIVKLTKEIIQAKAQLASELSKFNDAFEVGILTDTMALDARRDAAGGLLRGIHEQILGFPEKERRLIQMERDHQLLEKVYVLMAQELEQARLAEQAEDTTFTLLDEAIPPTRADSPRRVRNASAAFAIVAVLGLLWGASQERRRLDRLEAGRPLSGTA